MASLCRKYQKATTTVGTMNSAVEELTKSIGNSSWISEWKKLEEVARTKRGEALMIYNVSNTPGMFLISIIIFFHPLCSKQLHHKQRSTKILWELVEGEKIFSGY